MALAKTESNRKKYYDLQMNDLAKSDLDLIAETLKLKKQGPGQIIINFFKRDYLVSNSGVEPIDGGPVTFDHKSVIANYILFQGQGELENEFVPINRLTGILETKSGPSDHLVSPLVDKFGDKYEVFIKAAQKIGGQNTGKAPSGGEAWLFLPFPNLPLEIVFFEADEEFPAEVKVLFDSSARSFITYECLELLQIVLVIELLVAGNLLGCGHHQAGGEDGSCGCGCGEIDT